MRLCGQGFFLVVELWWYKACSVSLLTSACCAIGQRDCRNALLEAWEVQSIDKIGLLLGTQLQLP